MPNIDWTWLLIGMVLGLWVLPLVLTILKGRQTKVTATPA